MTTAQASVVAAMGTPASVVIVSRGRPRSLARSLTGVGQVWYHPFEVVVVADPAGCAAVAAHPLAGRIKLVPFDEPNIAAARNAGIAAAGGLVVAFLDDDAVPEPTWLSRLVAPLDKVEATGGFVLGRNGISFQWRARVVDATGVAHGVPVPGSAPFAPHPPEGGAVKTEGTNMAVRRDTLVALGGFDPRYRFFLDETDLNMRLAAAGARCLLVPRALVHHGFAASDRRRDDRVPISLFDIGASAEVFWASHTPPCRVPAARAALVSEQRARLLRHMVAGGCEPRDVGRLLSTLDAGFAAGRQRQAEPTTAVLPAAPDFRPLNEAPPRADMLMLGGRWRDRDRLVREAREAIDAGGRASVILLSAGARRHRVTFTDDGIWLQTGGVWGRSDRQDSAVAIGGRVGQRLDRETIRVRDARCPNASAD